MTDSADRIVWEADRDALYRHGRGRAATETDAEREGGSQDTGDATDAREASYAEAINRLFAVNPEQMRDLVDAVMAVADAEQSELRAEVERLKRGGAELGRILDRTLRDALDASGRHDVIEEDGDGDWALVWETLAELRPRAEAAEAEVKRLRIRHHEKCFQRRPEGIPDDLPVDEARQQYDGPDKRPRRFPMPTPDYTFGGLFADSADAAPESGEGR